MRDPKSRLTRRGKKKQRVRIWKILVPILIVLFVYYIGSGIYYSRYKPEKSDNYLWGVYHVHSNLSDGIYSLEKISKSAKKARISFIILTDHGAPNIKASLIRKNYNGVFIIGGSEAGIPDGHLTFFGVSSLPPFKLPPYPPDAITDIREWKGFPILAYPDDPKHQWQYWDDEFFPDGIEIINITSYFRKLSIFGLIKTIFYYPFSQYTFLKHMTPPSVSLNKWNDFLSRGRIYGFYAANAHGGIRIGKRKNFAMPSYTAVFSLIGMGIDKNHKKSLEKAIRSGDFFSIIRGAGEPQKFEFFARQGVKIFRAGSMLNGDATVNVSVKSIGLQHKILLIRNGEVVDEAIGNELMARADKNGFYRAEVYLIGHPFLPPDVPWIISNPIFKDMVFCKKRKQHAIKKIKDIPIKLSDFHVEKDKVSQATYTLKGDKAVFSYSLLRKNLTNRWCSLALRKKMDLSSYKGVYFIGESDRYMRYWVEIRSAEKWHYASFKIYPKRENRVFVPFKKFYLTNGRRKRLPLKNIDSLFLSVNSSNTQVSISGWLQIRAIGFYTE